MSDSDPHRQRPSAWPEAAPTGPLIAVVLELSAPGPTRFASV